MKRWFHIIAIILTLGAVNSLAQNGVWVRVDDEATLERLKAEGFTVNSRFGNVATISVPTGQYRTLRDIPGVKATRRAQRVELNNDKALLLSHGLLEGLPVTSDTLPYTGRGVVVGVIDTGFDFNHINFKDSDGHSRVAAVYLPADSTGSAPVVNGDSLPGSAYYGDDIAALTTDNDQMSHATHTTGTAAGSYAAQGYRGVAPGATLVLCGMTEEELTDANIANSVNFIFDYAERNNMPAVINMSLGSSDGAHDGSSWLSQAFDKASGPGRICVVSAGNQGEVPCHWEHKFEDEGDTVRTFLSNWRPSNPRYSGYASSWSTTDAPHRLTLAIVDLEADTVCHSVALDTLAVDDDGMATIDASNDSIWARYFDGFLQYQSQIADNGRFNAIVAVDVTPAEYNRYALGMLYSAPKGEMVHAWTSSIYFWSRSKSGWTTGTANMSISDMATGENAISVGAYCSRKTTPKYNGSEFRYSRSAPYAIAYFSSYGPDARGIQRPDVTAPGFAVVSSANRYDSTSNIIAHLAFRAEVDGELYPYGSEYGTSMSTPVVTGAIAVWLQADPTLDAARVRNVLKATSYRDEYVTEAQAQRWGAGKLDIAAGLEYVLRNAYDVNLDGEVNVGDISAVYAAILGTEPEFATRADLNHDGYINSGDISTLYRFLINQ